MEAKEEKERRSAISTLSGCAKIAPYQHPFSGSIRTNVILCQIPKGHPLKERRRGEFEIVVLTQKCSSMLRERIPTKMKDPGSFTIPCSIGDVDIGKALCDLGASINLMPLSMFKKLGIESRSTTMTLQLADQSIVHPEGNIKDVLVKIDRFILPADFIILDYETNKNMPIILEWSFLSTGRTLIDFHKGEITMRVNNQEVIFNVFYALEYPGGHEKCQSLDADDEFKVKRELDEDEEKGKEEEYLDAQQPEQCCTMVHTGSLNINPHDHKSKPSMEQTPELELKVLPAHLKYAYLGEGTTLPVIISIALSLENELALLEVLKKYIQAIG